MMLKRYFSLIFLLCCLSILFTSCADDEPCDGVICPAGQICEDGTCVSFDACNEINCPDGQICDNGNCIDDPNSSTEETISGTITSDATWQSSKIYLLQGRVVIPDGVTLTIEAGTIIKGLPGADESASALIIARGAKIIAEGTESAPIIFTSSDDNIELGQIAGANLTNLNNQLWGGIIILGRAPISAGNGDTEAQIEGIPPNEESGKYGGTDANDSSGILKYVSIRHGGISIGDGNEINGLTLGGVGSGTVIDHIEVAATLDDGIEFFGGTVDVSNAIVTWQGDDGIDIDQNYSGTVDNFLVVHGGSDTDEALEVDGPEGETYTAGQFNLVNGTLIAVDTEKTSGADFKSLAQGTVVGCSWRGYNKFVKIRASFNPADCSEKPDAYTNAATNQLTFVNNEVVSTFATNADVAIVYSDDDPGEEVCFNAVANQYNANVQAAVIAGNNTISESANFGADLSVFDGWTLASANGWY